MNLKHLFSRQTVKHISSSSLRISARVLISSPDPSCTCRNATGKTPSAPFSILSPNNGSVSPRSRSQRFVSFPSFSRYIHSSLYTELNDLGGDTEFDSGDDGPMNEFLSRFVWIMRGKLSGVYPECDKNTIDGMLLIIVEKVVTEMEKGGIEQRLGDSAGRPSHDFSEDLWKTVWEVSNVVLEDMHKARKKEKMKGFLQSEDVKEMWRFASEIGLRGDMLRELRYKWAREKMEESEFYQNLERLRQDEARLQNEEDKTVSQNSDMMSEDAVGDESPSAETSKVFTLPKRHGKMKYKIYGLDLSDPKWAEVADRIHKTEEVTWPQEPKEISGKCKLVTEKILSLQQEDDPSPFLAEWVELLQPSRIDWISLLDKLKEGNTSLYFKVAEILLDEESFQTNIRDYSKLIDAHAKENQLEDAERILKRMTEKGIQPDILTSTILVHMYTKAGNLQRAKEALESLRNQGFQPDTRIFNSMITAYVNNGDPKSGETLMREMEARDIKPTKEIYMSLLRSFSQHGDVDGAQRIATTMQFAGFQPGLESSTLLIEAFEQAGKPDQARNYFDYMIRTGQKPDDRCTASMIAAYEKGNLLDKALNLLMELQKDGFEPGVATCTVLVDWLGKLQLIDEAEQVLSRIAELGEAPPFKIQISLCVMYAKAGKEKKALQALGVLEAKNEQLRQQDYETVINALISGGMREDAQRMSRLMEARGIPKSDKLNMTLISTRTFQLNKRPTA